MGIGLSGMISGLDTDSIVKAMVSGQQLKATKIENKITLNKWTTEAWSGLNTKIYSFAIYFLILAQKLYISYICGNYKFRLKFLVLIFFPHKIEAMRYFI